MKYLLIISLLCLAFTCERIIPESIQSPPWDGQTTISNDKIILNDCGGEYVMRGGRYWQPYSALNYSPYWRPLDGALLGRMVDTLWVNPTRYVQRRGRRGAIVWDTTYHAIGQSVPSNPYTCTEQLIFGDSVLSFQGWSLFPQSQIDTVRFGPTKVHTTEYISAAGRRVAIGGFSWRKDGRKDTLVIEFYRSNITQPETIKLIHP